MGKRGRHWATAEESQAAALERGLRLTLGIEGCRRWVELSLAAAAGYEALAAAEGDMRQHATTRGERWRATYQLRWAERQAALHRAEAAGYRQALAQLEADQPMA